MPETLPDILAAAAHDVGLSDPGHCLHNAYGSECVDVMSRVLDAIPARDREAWERALDPEYITVRQSRDEHPQSRTCPGCGADLQRVAIITIAYIWTDCECRVAIDYDHLYEQLWHIDCLRETPRSRLAQLDPTR
ncbi:MAG: hypothetical protein KF809_17220 [Chloroflexi bacterium]|nr:hypothetical protein [Chloroflexota bacterium]